MASNRTEPFIFRAARATKTARLPYPLDGDCFVGMDVPTGMWGAEEVAFWTGTARYQPWKDVAAFFRSKEIT